MPSILIVEDEAYIRELLTVTFQREGFATFSAEGVEDAYQNLSKETIDLVLLDLNLHGKSGFDVCHYIKQHNPGIGVIMVTAKGQDVDKVFGLEAGADDYVVKPFNPYELVARVRSLLRRMNVTTKQNQIDTSSKVMAKEGVTQDESVLQFGYLTIQVKGKSILRNGVGVKVTPKEFELLLMLAKHPHMVLSRDELLDKIWGSDQFVDFKTVDVHVARLREKIEENPKKPMFIETVWGVGYKWKG